MSVSDQPLTDAGTDAYYSAKIRRSAERIIKLIDLKAPSVVISNEIGLLFQTGLVYNGKYLMDFVAEHMISAARQRSGLCLYCTNDVAVSRSHPPICEKCDHLL